MGEMGYRIAIGAGSSPHNPRGSAVLKEDVKSYRKAWIDAGHPGDPTTVVRIPTPGGRDPSGGHTPDRGPHGPCQAVLRRAGWPSEAPTRARPAPTRPRR